MVNSTETNLNLSISPLTAHYMPRPRIDKIFDQASSCKLVYVIAGAGCGKTQAVHHYVEGQTDAVVRWLQLTESDNIGSRYWENLTHNVALDNPYLADKLREFGFPETLARFKQFAEILKNAEHRSHKTFLVLDDFHLIHSKQALVFAERCAHLQIPGACVIIISRKEPEINAVSLFSKGKASIITEDELRFTDDEIADYLKHLAIPFPAKELQKCADATKGWALAVKMLSLILKKIPQNFDLALDIMKQNIFKLLEMEAFYDFPETVQKRLAELSLISDLPLVLLGDIFNDPLFAQYMPLLASFIWFDSFYGDYRIHPLYLEFLQGKQHILSDDEKQDIYRRAAQWCFENSFFTDAVNYYAKSRQYDRVLEVLLSYPFRLPPDTCEYFLNILEELGPDDDEKSDYNVLLLKNLFIPLLYLGMGKYEEAKKKSADIICQWEHSDMPVASYLLYTAYSNLAYIATYTCTVTHNYDFSDHLKKAVEYFNLSSVPPVTVTGPFGVADIRSFACLVGEGAKLSEFDKFIEKSRETSLYIAQTYHNMYYGYDDLAACELAFFKNQLDIAGNHAHNAVIKAREKKQYSIEIMAQQYLLRIAIHEGNYPFTKELLKQLNAHLQNPDFGNRQLLYDLFAGSFYIHIGLTDMAPSWFAIDEKDAAPEIHIPTRELIVGVRYYLATGQYKQALSILCNSHPRAPHERFLFGELIFSLLFAVARFATGDMAGSAKDFEKAYELSFNGEFEMPFIELGKSFRLLASTVQKQKDCVIPEQWLISTERKASVYTKRSAVIANSFKREKNIKEDVLLSARELEVLNDLYHGLSREEIAEIRYLSVNTVKKILQSIYIKLDATNNVDAIRIALEKKLIK
ncbi:MAG: LuxR C-terminal-related transcriptional regulator [Oscillospiraceae bacterium]|nr:LuxR C-terminal-related transcriptional regulator [Oscillospiraceae bacterium]